MGGGGGGSGGGGVGGGGGGGEVGQRRHRLYEYFRKHSSLAWSSCRHTDPALGFIKVACLSFPRESIQEHIA